MRTLPVIGLPVAVTDYSGAVAWILEKAALRDRPYAVEAANTHVAALARRDTEFGDSMAKFDLICPDGMPLVWSLNRQLRKEAKKETGFHHEVNEGHEVVDTEQSIQGGLTAPHKLRASASPRNPLTFDHCPMTAALTTRVYGPTLMLETIRATNTPESPHRHFLLGGKSSTLEKLTARFAAEFPHSAIAATYSPPFGPWPDDEFDRIAEKITSSQADLVWVGLGCPRQEHWIAKNKHRLPPAVYFGIGAAFAFHAGEVKQAPASIQKFGLEWAYRLAMEPRRLFKRYLTYNSLFFWYSLQGSRR